MLSQIDPDELLTSGVYRRAARHLATRIDAPLGELPPGDDQLARAIADLVERTGRVGEVREEHVEHARLVLELDRLDRALAQARASVQSASSGTERIPDLARAREDVLAGIRGVVARLEQPV